MEKGDKNNMEAEKINALLKNGEYGVIFPKAKKDEKAAIELADLIENAKAVASFEDNETEGQLNYGVIVDLILLDDTIEEE